MIKRVFSILFIIGSVQVSKAEDKLHNEPCGKVVLVKYSSDSIEVILRPIGAKSNRGEIFKKNDFDLSLASQVALEALKNKALLFCVSLNKDNKLEFYLTK